MVLSFAFSPPPRAFLLLPPLGSLLRVHALVPPQVAEGTAGIAAVGAVVGLLARVRARVPLQVDQLRGGIRTDGAAVGLLAVVDPHVTLQVVGVVGGEGAERAGVQLGGWVTGSGPAQAPPLPLRDIVNGGFRRLGALRLGGVDGGFVLQALLTGETVKLRPQVQAHTCSPERRW